VLGKLEGLYELNYENSRYTLDIMPFRLEIAKLSKKSIYMYVSVIKNFVKFLNDYKKINITLKGAQQVKTPKSLPKPLPQSDIVAVINNQSLKVALIVKIFYGLGLRISELASIEIANIKGGFLRVVGKGNKTREVPIMPSLQRDIELYLKEYQPKKYLFEKSGVSMKDTQIRYIINKTFKQHGIKATPHQLRHSFASHLLKEGARISDVSELLGHSSMASTQIYTKLNDSTKLKNYLQAHPLAKE
jgi:integrase/recombinase XerC